MKKKYLSESFGLATGTIVYVGLVGLIMTNAEHIFGSMPSPINFMTFLYRNSENPAALPRG